MGSNNLEARSDGQTVQSNDVNQYRNEAIGDRVPRNSSGSPEASQGSLGTSDLPWKDIYITGQFIKNDNLIDFSALIGASHQIVSGTTLSSGYPDFLTFLAATTTGRIIGTPSSLVTVINNTSVTVSSNIDVTGLTVGPTANHTCLINDSAIAGAESTKLLGEDGNSLTIGTIGSSITALNGTIQVFQKGSEYFLAYIDSSNNKLWPYKRGIARTDRETLSNGATITMRQGNYIFLDSDGASTYKTTIFPSFATTQPSSPASNQWNYNTTNQRWERYSGSWSNMNAHWLGTVICDGSAAVAADANDFNHAWKSTLQGAFVIQDADTLRVNLKALNVAGHDFILGDFGQTIKLSVSGDRESGVSETASTDYYIYADNALKIRFSTIAPRYGDQRQGLYHPKQYWRYLGYIYNDNSSNITRAVLDGNSRSSQAVDAVAYPQGHHGTAPPLYVTASTVTVAFVRERDSGNTANITKNTSTTVDVGTTGLNGVTIGAANLTGTVSVSGTAVTFSASQTGILQIGDPITTAGNQTRRLASGAGTSWVAESAFSTIENLVTCKRGGRAANTFYYLYAISDGTTPGLILTSRNVAAGNTLVDLPSGYTLSSQIPYFIRTDSSGNIVDHMITSGWPRRPSIQYRVDISTSGTGTANIATGLSSTSFVALSAATWVPPICRAASFTLWHSASSTFSARDVGSSLSIGYAQTLSGNNEAKITPLLSLSAAQALEYKISSGTLKMDAYEVVVTEVA